MNAPSIVELVKILVESTHEYVFVSGRISVHRVAGKGVDGIGFARDGIITQVGWKVTTQNGGIGKIVDVMLLGNDVQLGIEGKAIIYDFIG